jgi:hypothetical protein
MKVKHFEIKVELYVGGICKSKNYYYYSDINKMNDEIKEIIDFVKNDDNLYIDEHKVVGNRTIVSIPSMYSDYHYFLVAKTKEVNFDEKIKL